MWISVVLCDVLQRSKFVIQNCLVRE